MWHATHPSLLLFPADLAVMLPRASSIIEAFFAKEG
jgi:hypothetical protein